MIGYPVRENPIGSAVIEILRYRQKGTQTDKQTSCYFIIRIIIIKLKMQKKYES